MSLSSSDKETINRALYPPCEDGFPIKGEPTQRECVRKEKDRHIHLPKVKGIFVVNNPRKCQQCQKKEQFHKPHDRTIPAKFTSYNGGEPQTIEQQKTTIKLKMEWMQKHCLRNLNNHLATDD